MAMDPSPPTAYKSLVHADDAAAAVVDALGAPSGIYNVCEDDPMTSGEQCDLVAGLVERKKLRNVMGAVTWIAGSKVEILKRSQRVSNKHFKETTGWTPRYPSLREGYPAALGELEALEVLR
jgi:nucleoside-diphosphate-sugar epimerase